MTYIESSEMRDPHEGPHAWTNICGTGRGDFSWCQKRLEAKAARSVRADELIVGHRVEGRGDVLAVTEALGCVLVRFSSTPATKGASIFAPSEMFTLKEGR